MYIQTGKQKHKDFGCQTEYIGVDKHSSTNSVHMKHAGIITETLSIASCHVQTFQDQKTIGTQYKRQNYPSCDISPVAQVNDIADKCTADVTTYSDSISTKEHVTPISTEEHTTEVKPNVSRTMCSSRTGTYLEKAKEQSELEACRKLFAPTLKFLEKYNSNIKRVEYNSDVT